MAEKKGQGTEERGQMTVKEAGERVRDLVEKGKEVEAEQGKGGEASQGREQKQQRSGGNR